MVRGPSVCSRRAPFEERQRATVHVHCVRQRVGIVNLWGHCAVPKVLVIFVFGRCVFGSVAARSVLRAELMSKAMVAWRSRLSERGVDYGGVDYQNADSIF